MIFTNKQAIHFFTKETSGMPQSTKKCVKINRVVDRFVLEYNPQHIEKKHLLYKFSDLLNNKPHKKTNIEHWESKTFIEFKMLPGKRKNSLLGDEPCTKVSKNILQEAVKYIEGYAAEQNISKEEALSMISNECKRVWKYREEKPKGSMSVDDATALIYNVNLSSRQYQMIRSLCLPHGLLFPTRNDVDKFKKSLHPPIFSCQIKSSVDFDHLLRDTARSLIDLQFLDSQTQALAVQKQFSLVGKFGIDGSGAHKIRHQIIDHEKILDETPHLDPSKIDSILLSCYVPLTLTMNDNIVWENPVPNSTVFARPVSLTRCKEIRPVIEKELEPIFNSLKRQPTFSQIDEVTTVSFRTECSMVDGKMVDIIQGDSGAFCHYCTSTKSDCNDLLNISNGFNINKNYQSCLDAWQKVVESNKPLPSSERQGQCHEPIVKNDLFCFSILHFKLRSLDFVQKVLYHLVAGTKTWTEAGNAKRDIAAIKKKCIDHIKVTTGMIIDTPCGVGGNTNSGPLAGRFFDPSNRNHICDLIPDQEDKENYSILLSKFNIILTVIEKTSQKLVDYAKLKNFGIELMEHIKSFLDEKGDPWIMIIPTVHQLCAHTWELFQINQGKSISKWSESPLESWNKHVRSFQSGPAARARQDSVKHNIHDIFKRMLIRSNPSIAAKYPRPTCSICGDIGHTARSIRHKMASVSTHEKDLISSFYV